MFFNCLCVKNTICPGNSLELDIQFKVLHAVSITLTPSDYAAIKVLGNFNACLSISVGSLCKLLSVKNIDVALSLFTFLIIYSLVPGDMTSFISTIFYCGSKHHTCFLKKPLNAIIQSYSNNFFICRVSDA